MRVKPTRKTLRSTYEMLRSLPPFDGMRLPDADKVRFLTCPKGSFWGQFWYWRGKPTIWISEHQTLSGLVATMAHEMLHLQQWAAGTDSAEQHNYDFRKLSHRVCSRLGIEVGGF